MSADNIELEGIVESCSHDIFFVRIENPVNKIVKCTLSGKLRINHIRVILGDKVKINVSPYDTGFETGKITSRITKTRQ